MSPHPLALYIHWPFCLSKCPYCDFNSHVRSAPDEEKFAAGLMQEMRYWQKFSGRRALSSIFFGGGTPSLMSAKTVAALIGEAEKLFGFSDGIEITLEANPTSSEAEKFKGFHTAGVNRVSLGVQALEDAALKALGRQHGAAEAEAAVRMAAEIFPRFSFDLIYARKNQSTAAWEEELRRALKFARAHLSLYQLTIEPGTLFAKQTAQGAAFQASNDDSEAMFEMTNAMMAEAGIPSYEISNYAAPGEACRHNLTYWNYGDYIGIGPGAHGRLKRDEATQGRRDESFIPCVPASLPSLRPSKFATQNLRAPEAWLKSVTEKNHGAEAVTELSGKEMREEALLMGLRLADGIGKKNWREMFGEYPEDFLSAEKLRALKSEGLIAENSTHLRATPEGRMKLNAVLDYLVN